MLDFENAAKQRIWTNLVTTAVSTDSIKNSGHGFLAFEKEYNFVDGPV